MKDFTRSAGRLASLPFPARLVYTVFLAFTLGALALTAWLGQQMVGADASGTREYYAGRSAGATSRSPAADGGGPAFDVPDTELRSVENTEPMALRKLLEVTHFHLFSMPVYLLILSHLFMLSSLGARVKIVWITLATLAVIVHIAAPWIARADAAGATAIFAGSGALLAATFLVLSAVPLAEMWRQK